MGTKNINIPHDRLALFCKRHYICSLSLFGSALREDFRDDSNIDVLVEFQPGHVPGLTLIRMEDELSALLGGRRVNLVRPKFLNPRIRDRILAEAKVEYAER